MVDYPGRSWCRHFLRNFGYSLLSNGCDGQAWLPYSHPDMEASRAHMRQLLEEKCHAALVLNYDQMWRVAFSYGGKLLWKDRSSAGLRCQKRKISQKCDKKLHHVKGSRRSLTVSRTQFMCFWFLFRMSCVHVSGSIDFFVTSWDTSSCVFDFFSECPVSMLVGQLIFSSHLGTLRSRL